MDYFFNNAFHIRNEDDALYQEVAKINYYVIKYIEEEKLDESVEGSHDDEPTIKYLKDASELNTLPSDNELKEFKQACSEYTKKFADILAA